MSFFDRFVHPRLAITTTVAVVIWVIASLVAGTGVALGYGTIIYDGALLGALGSLVFIFCVLWFVSLYVVRFVRTQASGH